MDFSIDVHDFLNILEARKMKKLVYHCANFEMHNLGRFCTIFFHFFFKNVANLRFLRIAILLKRTSAKFWFYWWSSNLGAMESDVVCALKKG